MSEIFIKFDGWANRQYTLTNCERCGVKFEVQVKELKRGAGRFCSRFCKYEHISYAEKSRRYRSENPEKVKAQRLAYREIKIDYNSMCKLCGSKEKLERHHKDYSKPLEVEILCTSCHKKRTP